MSARDWPRVQALSLYVEELGLLVDLSKTSRPGCGPLSAIADRVWCSAKRMANSSCNGTF